jgi:hypothetical protein
MSNTDTPYPGDAWRGRLAGVRACRNGMKGQDFMPEGKAA